MSNLSTRRLGVVMGVALMGACHRSPPQSMPAATRTVFTDSVLHAVHCVPVQPGEDWRRVCTPRDQGLVLRRRP